MEVNTIYNECCLKTLKRLKDNSIDLVVTSPPYNMNKNKYNNFNDNFPFVEYYLFQKKVLTELIRVSKVVFLNVQIVNGNRWSMAKILGDFADYFKEIIVWNKLNGFSATKGMIVKWTELILIFEKQNPETRVFDYGNFKAADLRDIWNIRIKRSLDKTHEATFPLTLVAKILNNFTTPSQLIYDPFMGTGTTAVACKALGRNYLGSEIDKSYFELINRRLANVKTIQKK